MPLGRKESRLTQSSEVVVLPTAAAEGERTLVVAVADDDPVRDIGSTT